MLFSDGLCFEPQPPAVLHNSIHRAHLPPNSKIPSCTRREGGGGQRGGLPFLVEAKHLTFAQLNWFPVAADCEKWIGKSCEFPAKKNPCEEAADSENTLD